MLVWSSRVIGQIFKGFLKPSPPVSPVVETFRCWPMDIDLFLHMNNSNYFRYAELARWRIVPQTGGLSTVMKEGWMFLAVEQTIKHLGQIKAFQKFNVTTKTLLDGKWVYYEHTLEQHPDDVEEGQEPKIYAEILTKAVIKQRNGKTVRLLESGAMNEFAKKTMLVKEDNK